MRPVKTASSNDVFTLAGGNEDNDLWCQRGDTADGEPATLSVWVPTAEERAAIAAGRNLALVVFSEGHPPVALGITDEQPISPRDGEVVDHNGTIVTIKLTVDGQPIDERCYPAADLQSISRLGQRFARGGEQLEIEVSFDPPVRT
jgi:hypothetical protein